MLSCLWDGAYKLFLAANRRVVHVVNDPLPYVIRRNIIVNKIC